VHSQGKQFHLGTFPDPVSAAMYYDREATRVRGADALVNFPPGCSPGPTTPATPPTLPAVEESGQTGPRPNDVLPPGNAEASPVPNIGPIVSLTPAFWGIFPSRLPPPVSILYLHADFSLTARHGRVAALSVGQISTWCHDQDFYWVCNVECKDCMPDQIICFPRVCCG
jgi:hypothetical protein